MKKPIYKRWWFWLIVVFVVIGIAGSIGGNEPQEASQGDQIAQTQTGTTDEELAGLTETSEPISQDEPAQTSKETLSQKNAVAMAKNYLNYTPFSKSGLIEQLNFEGFSDEDATYAVNQIDIDWKEQAVMMGENYLDYTSFSRSGLIEQLAFEGFSNEDATYAADKIGL